MILLTRGLSKVVKLAEAESCVGAGGEGNGAKLFKGLRVSVL